MSKTNYPLVKVDWNEVKKLTQGIANKLIADNKKIDLIVPIIRGGMPIAMLLSSMLDVEEMSCIHIRRSIDDNPNTEFKRPINKGITNTEARYKLYILSGALYNTCKMWLINGLKEDSKFLAKTFVDILYPSKLKNYIN